VNLVTVLDQAEKLRGGTGYREAVLFNAKRWGILKFGRFYFFAKAYNFS